MKSNFRSIRRGDEAKTSIANQFPTTFDPATRDIIQPLESTSDVYNAYNEPIVCRVNDPSLNEPINEPVNEPDDADVF